MAKRFTDTDKWKKPFIKGLPVEYKVLWFYMLDDCDMAGLWQVDLEVAELRIGTKLSREKALEVFADHIVVLPDTDKWFIPSFIEFQYGSNLSKTNNVYNSIAKILNKYDLYQYLTVSITDEGTTISSFRNRISKKVKDKVLLEAGLICQYCQCQKTVSELVVDHFVPLKKGGDNSDANLVCSCVRCNSHKTDLAPDDFLLRNHSFLNPTDKVISLLAAYKNQTGAFKDLSSPKDMVKDKDKVKDKVKEQEEEPLKIVSREAIDEKLTDALDELYIDEQRMKWAHVDFDLELFSFIEKVRGSPDKYAQHDTSGIRQAFQYQLRNAKKKSPNGKNDRTQQNRNDLAIILQHASGGADTEQY